MNENIGIRHRCHFTMTYIVVLVLYQEFFPETECRPTSEMMNIDFVEIIEFMFYELLSLWTSSLPWKIPRFTGCFHVKKN